MTTRLFVVAGACLLAACVATADDASGTGYCSGASACLTTYHNNNLRVGVNSKETSLSAANFPSLTASSLTVDGMVYAQPLYVHNVPFNKGSCTSGTRNILYVATENNSIYAIDADAYSTCYNISLNKTGENAIPVTALPQTGSPAAACNNLTGSSSYGTVGITSTPVIDPGTFNGVNTNVMFVVSAHQSGSTYISRLNAVDIKTLALLDQLDLNTPINNAKPTGYPTFYTLNENQRSGLLLDKSSSAANIYLAWGSFCDASISSGGYFGLVAEFDYNYSTKKFGTTVESFYPAGSSSGGTSGASGVWMSGGAPAADSGGNVYVAVGNGNFTATGTPQNFGESVLKLGGAAGAFALEDYYTPNVWSALNSGTTNSIVCAPGCSFPNGLLQGDWDLGAGGVVLLTNSSGSAYGELIAGGKEGVFYVTYYCTGNLSTQCPTTTSWNQLMGGLDGGGYSTDTGSNYSSVGCTTASSPTAGDIAQCFEGVSIDPQSRADSGQRATPAFWAPGGSATPYLYTVGTNDVLKAFTFSSGTFATPAAATGNPPTGTTFAYPGASPTVSWDGTHTNTAIVWVLDTHAWNSGTNNREILTAYTAVPSSGTLAQLWTSGTSTGPGATKFMVPTVANGKIYLGGQSTSGCGTTCQGMVVIYHQ